jgi:hypothetical protein
VSAIKELSQEDPCNVYLCEDSTGVVKGMIHKYGKTTIYVKGQLEFFPSFLLAVLCFHGPSFTGPTGSVVPCGSDADVH